MSDTHPAPAEAELDDGRHAAGAHTSTAIPVSVVMPVRNEERHLGESVSHVLTQEYPGELELVLAVGPSKDRTEEIAQQIAAADSRITMAANPSGHIPSALNIAIGASRHDVIVRMDGHALMPPGYVATALRTLADTGAVNVGGIMAAEGTTPFERAVAWALTSPFGVGAAPNHTGGDPGPADTVYLGAFRREAVVGVGGYDERYLRAEDWEMNHRLRKAGGLIWFQPALRVTYRPRATVGALSSQFFHYGRWRRVVARQHAGTTNMRYLAPPLAVAAMAAGTLAGVAGVASFAAGAGGWLPALLTAGFVAPAAYLAGVLGVTATAARTLRGRDLAALPVALTTMHVSWGAGFLTSPRRLVPKD
jgi:succinoglycan biosynthesis protein ExoA